MKGKILTILFLALALIIVIGLGYETVYTSPNGISLKNLNVKTYSGNKTTYSFVGQQKTLLVLKGYLLTWYREQPTENLEVSSHPSGSGALTLGTSGNVYANTFVPQHTGVLSKVRVEAEYNPTYSAPTMKVEIRTTYANGTPTSTVLASGTVSITSSSWAWYTIVFSDPPQVQAGTKYAVVCYYIRGGSWINLYICPYSSGGDYIPDGDIYKASSSSSSFSYYSAKDFGFEVYLQNGTDLSTFQISMDYSISPKYTVAYHSDVGRSLNTFNYTINIYHNVDSNQSWVLAYSTSYTNVTSISSASYSSPWIDLLSGTYTTDYHTYYYKVEVVVEAFDTITGQQINNTAYVILSDQFYWQSYMSFNPQVSIVESNMVVQDVVQPYSIILAMIVILSYFIVRKRMMERD